MGILTLLHCKDSSCLHKVNSTNPIFVIEEKMNFSNDNFCPNLPHRVRVHGTSSLCTRNDIS